MSKLSAVACDVYWTGCIGLGVLDWVYWTRCIGLDSVHSRPDGRDLTSATISSHRNKYRSSLETDLPHPRC